MAQPFRFLIAGLLISLAFDAGCSRNRASVGANVDPALLTLVPQDTSIIAGVRFEALEKTPIYQKYLATVKFAPLDNFMRATGIEVRKNVWEFLIVSNGSQSVLLGRGKFANEMEPKLERDGAKRLGYKNFNLLGEDQNAVVFINSSTAAIGSIDALKYLIDQSTMAHGTPLAIAALIKDIPPTAQIWAAYAGGGFDLSLPGNLANANRLLGSISTGTVYLDLTSGLKGLASGMCSTDKNAQEVEGALSAFLGLARMGAIGSQPGKKNASEIYDSIHISREAQQVRVLLDAPEDRVEEIVNLWVR